MARPKRRGFFDEAALGLAEAVRADPVFAAAVLLASTLFLRDARWDVGAAFLAGAAVSRRARGTRWIVLLLIAGVARGLDSDFAVREWADIDRMAPVFTATPRWHRVAVLLVAAAAGMRSFGFALLGAALGVAVPIVRGETFEPSWPLVWSGASIALAALSATGRSRLGLGVALGWLFTASAWSYALSGWTLTVSTPASNGAGVVTEAAFVLWPVLAGLAAREVRDGDGSAGPARLLTFVQRSPWAAVSFTAAIVVLHGAPSFPLGGPVEGYWSALHSMAMLCVGSTFLVSLEGAPRSGRAGLVAAFWLSAAVLTAWGVSGSGQAGPYTNWALAQTAFAAFGPLVLGNPVRDPAPRWVTSRELPLLVAVLVALPACLEEHEWEHRAYPISLVWLWLALAPVAFRAATCVAASSRRIVALSAALGLASWLALVAGGTRATRYECATAVGVWFLGGVYVVIARRARSLTAVPLDHPVVTDFGGD